MKYNITFISDTHNLHEKVHLPGGDILIHSGDATNTGKKPEIENFLGWFSNQNYTHKIFIAGNHDYLFQTEKYRPDPIHRELGVQYLEDTMAEMDGIRIYGTPWQPEFFNWAFNLPRNGIELMDKWDLIPNDLDILISHGPPWSMLDLTNNMVNVGCDLLYEKVKKSPPVICCFGHIHFSRGIKQSENTLFINSCICGENYRAINQPITLEYDSSDKSWDVISF